jgi:membrane protease YdiL (CAAX protease family)
MIGIIVQLAISWLLIWSIEKKDLGVLGLRPTKQRMTDMGLFFIITAACAASGFLIRIYFGERWVLNPVFSGKLLLEGLWWNIKSVLYEELIFRGVILYILIKRLGVTNAIIISAIGFGIYHWFSYEIIGNIKQMIIVLIATASFGLLYAYIYAKTFSLYIPCAIHLAWNFTCNFVFSAGNIGNGVLVMTRPDHTVMVSYVVYFLVVYLPMISAVIINYLLVRRRRQVELESKKPEDI